MRMVLSSSERDERGAIAVVVAVSSVFVLVLAAMVVDFGQAYTIKRQAQTAADAGSLAAAKVFKDEGGLCSTLVGSSTLQAKAEKAARDVAAANLGVLAADLKYTGGRGVCDGSVLKVPMTVKSDSPVGLGRIVPGQGGTITVDRSATAALGKSQLSVGNLRPWGLCSTQIPNGPYPSSVIEIGLPGNGHVPTGGCTTNTAGDWWRMSCFNGGGSHGDTEQNVLTGCSDVQIVPGQPTSATPSALSTYLRSKCSSSTGESVYCLGPDSGRDVKTLGAAWSTLLGKTISMPIFCDVPVPASTTAPDSGCNPTSVNDKKAWPVWRIAVVTICGFYLKGTTPTPNEVNLPAGDCRDLNNNGMKVSDFSGNDIGFLIIVRGLVTAGSTSTVIEGTETSVRLVQ